MNFTIGGLPKIPHKQFIIIEKKKKEDAHKKTIQHNVIHKQHTQRKNRRAEAVADPNAG